MFDVPASFRQVRKQQLAEREGLQQQQQQQQQQHMLDSSCTMGSDSHQGSSSADGARCLYAMRRRYNPQLATPSGGGNQERHSSGPSDVPPSVEAYHHQRQHRARVEATIQTPTSGGMVPWRDVDNPRLTPHPHRSPPTMMLACAHQDHRNYHQQQQQQHRDEQLLSRDLPHDGIFRSATMGGGNTVGVWGAYTSPSSVAYAPPEPDEANVAGASSSSRHAVEGALPSAHGTALPPPRFPRHEVQFPEEHHQPERGPNRGLLVRKAPAAPVGPQQPFDDSMRKCAKEGGGHGTQGRCFSHARPGDHNSGTEPVCVQHRQAKHLEAAAPPDGVLGARHYDEGHVFGRGAGADQSDYEQAKHEYYDRFTRRGSQRQVQQQKQQQQFPTPRKGVGWASNHDGDERKEEEEEEEEHQQQKREQASRLCGQEGRNAQRLNTIDTSPGVTINGRGTFNTPLADAKRDVDELFAPSSPPPPCSTAGERREAPWSVKGEIQHLKAPPLMSRYGGELKLGESTPKGGGPVTSDLLGSGGVHSDGPSGRRRTDITDPTRDSGGKRSPVRRNSVAGGGGRGAASSATRALRPPEFESPLPRHAGDRCRGVEAAFNGGASSEDGGTAARALLEIEMSRAREPDAAEMLVPTSTASWPLVDEVMLMSPITTVEECRGETRSLINEIPKSFAQAFHQAAQDADHPAAFYFVTGHEQGAVSIYSLAVARRRACWEMRLTRGFTHLHLAPVVSVDCTNGVLTSGAMDGCVRRTDCSNGAIIASFSIVGLDVRDLETPHPLDASTLQKRSAQFRASPTAAVALCKSPVSVSALHLDQNLLAVGTSRGSVAVFLLSEQRKPICIVEGESPVHLSSVLVPSPGGGGAAGARLSNAVLAVEINAGTGALIAADCKQIIVTEVTSWALNGSVAPSVRRIFTAPHPRSFASVAITPREVFASTFDGWVFRVHRYAAGFSSQELVEKGAVNVRNADSLAHVISRKVLAQDHRLVTADEDSLMRLWRWSAVGFYGTAQEDAARDPIPTIHHVQDVVLSRRRSLQHVVILFNRFCLIATDINMELYNCNQAVVV